MAKKKEIKEIPKYSEDMSAEENKLLSIYIDNGIPGAIKINESQVLEWFELYMSGKTYTEISKKQKVDKELVLYISHKAKWQEQRMSHYADLVSNMTDKITQAKISSINTINTITLALGKYFEKSLSQYLSTNDDSIINTIDSKLLVQYYKSIDTLEKLTAVPDKNNESNRSSPVNINLNGDATIQQDSGSFVIDKENAGEILKSLAKNKKSKNAAK